MSSSQHEIPKLEQMNRREFLQTAAIAGIVLPAAAESRAGDLHPDRSFAFDPTQNLVPAPRDPAQWARFRKQLEAWRTARRIEIGYSDALYRRPDFAWVSRCFSCCFLMLCDERFYNPRRGQYRVEAFLDTMSQGAAEFRSRLDSVRPGVALEGELALPLEHIHDHHLSWAQWFNDSEVPGVPRILRESTIRSC